MMVLSPAATVIHAVPVSAPGTEVTPCTSTPLATSPARALSASTSSPTWAIIAVRAPPDAAATAWLAPLPPSVTRACPTEDGLSGRREGVGHHDVVDVDRADHHDERRAGLRHARLLRWPR